MKQSTELNNLLSLIFQDARTEVKDGRLLIPVEIAKRFGDQIRKFKPEIMEALGFCPVCSQKLAIEVREIEPDKKRTGRHACCPDLKQKHFDKWEF